MAAQEPPRPGGEGTGGSAAGGSAAGGSAAGADDAMRRLEERLDRASDAAERLLAEAAGTAARAAKAAAGGVAGSGGSGARETPAAGWQLPRTEAGPGSAGDFELLAQVIRSMRDLIPPELERRLAEALRELLLALRALIDWYLERSERRRADPAEVQDIPIA